MRLLLSLLILNLCAITSAAAQDSAGGSTAQSAAAPQDNSAKAKALIDQAIQALGGQAYLNAQNISQQGRTYSFHRGEATSAGTLFWRFVKFPDRERIELTKQRDVAYVYSGDKGFEITFKGTAALDDKALNEFLRRRDHSLELVLRKWINEPGVAFFYDGPAVAANKPADQVSVMNAKNDSVTLYLDTTTHLPLKKSFTWRDPTDNLRNTEEELYDAYRPTQGIMTPYSITRFYNGEMSNQRFLNNVTYNDPLNDSLFDAKTTYDPNTLPPRKK
ncbi:MAG TPA: hypothetical protein VFA40_13570 [Terriglobales bacterium]|nr:hypothetical protein [Terriglobales bacterium]